MSCGSLVWCSFSVNLLGGGGKVDEDDLDANTLNAYVDEPFVIVRLHGSR